MEAFVFAAGLRVVRAAVEDVDAEFEEPHAQFGPVLIGAIAPRRTIVEDDGLRQSITAEGHLHFVLHRGSLLVCAGKEADRIARMIIEPSEWMTFRCAGQREMSLEVHLPKNIWGFFLEAPIRLSWRTGGWNDAAIPGEDRMHG